MSEPCAILSSASVNYADGTSVPLPDLELFAGDQVPFVGPYNAVIGACAGAGFIAIVGWLGEAALKREAMGMGDVTLMAFESGVPWTRDDGVAH